MSGIRDTIKGGWHPKGKDGKSKESWRGDYKGIGQLSGWMGKGKDSSSAASEHISQPISQLKDPSAFGPPPKHINYHGGAAMPNQTTPDRSGLGAPLSQDQIRALQEAEEEAQREAEEAVKPKSPSVPYRVDTTGLSTAHLPPPPGRKDGADGRTPVSASKPKPPGLPPRLPPRQNSNPAPSPPPPAHSSTDKPDAHRGVLNQGALNRLGAAGVSVPGFGIGGGSSSRGKPSLPPPMTTSPSRSPAPASHTGNASQLNELQSRFSRFSSPKPESPSEGTTFAQKQEALKTASSFRNDPSSVSFSDAKAAASTANNFRERHGEQVKSGWQSANKLNTKYGISDKVGSYSGMQSQSPVAESPQIEMVDNTNSPALGTLGKKKPPPPPAKKKGLSVAGVRNNSGTPPSINLATRPKPSS